jgi:hypothetical protein
MNDCLITFRSVTPAQRAERVLKRAGFDCSIQRTPKWMEQQGCGYSVRIRYPQVEQAVHLLRENAVEYRKIYLRTGGGRVEELRL